MGNAPLLETRHLKKYFHVAAGTLHAVDDVSITINEGETLGVVGESGCGKSTLGRTVLRLLEATDGEVLFEGEDILKYGKAEMRAARRRMQMIFQDPYSSLNPRMTVEQLIAEFMIVNGSYDGSRKKIYERTSELMDIVGLAKRLASAYPHAVPQPEVHRVRRARVGARRVHPGADSQPPDGPAEGDGADLHVHHAQPFGGKAHLHGHRRDVPRTVRGEGAVPGAVLEPQAPVYEEASFRDPRSGSFDAREGDPADPGRGDEPDRSEAGLPVLLPLRVRLRQVQGAARGPGRFRERAYLPLRALYGGAVSLAKSI